MASNPNSDILLTDDGHPVGELVLASEDTIPLKANEEVENEARGVMLKRQAQELTGNPDASSAVAELYPRINDVEAREKAAKMFVVDDLSITEVSGELGVPQRTIAQWVFLYHWDDLKKHEVMTEHALSVLELARLRTKRRAEAVREQLDEAREIRRAAMDDIRNKSASTRASAEAWASAAKVEHSLLGVSEAGSVAALDDKDKDEQKGTGKTLVMVFNNQPGGLPPIRRSR